MYKQSTKRILSITLAAALSVGMLLPGGTAAYAENTANNKKLARYYTTNATGNGFEKTVAFYDDLSDWESSMIIAQGAANDDPNVYNSETANRPAQDLYTLYGAYDEDNLYLMWEMTDVLDAVSTKTLTQETDKMYNVGTYPFIIAIDTGKDDKIGNNCKTHFGDTLIDLGISFENDVNRIITVYSDNKLPAAIYCGNSGGINPSAMFEGTASGIRMKYGDGILSKSVYGINGIDNRDVNDIFSNDSEWVNFSKKGHDSASRDYHYEVSVPLDKLGLTVDDVRLNGIGISLVATGGKSGIDSLPYDVSMHDNVGSKDLEAKDNDHLTCKFARIGGTIVKSDLKNTSASSADTIVLGNSVTVNCKSADGIGAVQYAVYYKQNKQTTWSKVSDYSADTKVSVTPKSATSYTIRVKAKDESGKIVNKDIPLSVTKKLTNTSSLSANSINFGSSVNVNCSSVGGTGKAEYAVYYKQDSQSTWTKVKDYSSSTTASVKPKAVTSYTIRIKAKDSSGKIANKDLPLTVRKKSDLKNQSTLSASSITLRKSVNVNCLSSNGTGISEFAVYYKQNSQSTWTRVKGYSTVSSATVTPKAATSYTVRVKAKDQSGNIVNKDLPLTVTKAVHDPLNPPTEEFPEAVQVDGIKKTIRNLDDYYTVASEDDENYTPIEVLPKSVDNSKSEYFPPIINQVGPTCSVHGTIYYTYTYMYNKYHNIPTTYNNIFSPRFTYDLIDGTSVAGINSNVIYNRTAAFGAVTREYMPFGQDVYNTIQNDSYHYVLPSDEETYRFAVDHRIKSFFTFLTYNESQTIKSVDDPGVMPIKAALADGNILTASTYFTKYTKCRLKTSDDPIINKNTVGESCIVRIDKSTGSHLITIVGYDDNIWADINNNGMVDSGEMGAFKIANSYGTDWSDGNDGYIWMSYDALNMYSTVTDSSQNKECLYGLYSITGIKMIPEEDEKPYAFLKYSEKTDDRNHSIITLTGSYNDNEITECIDLYNRKADSDIHSSLLNYENPDEYIHFIYSLHPLMEKLGADDYTKVKWTVKFSHNENNGKSLSISDFYLCDEKNYRIYKPVGTLPQNLKTGSTSITFSDKYTRYANVYHRGFENSEIRYYFTDRTSGYKSADMEKTRLTRGYTHKYMIDLGEYDNAYVFFYDKLSNYDSNNGLHYVVHPGDNFFDNQQHIENFNSTVTIDTIKKGLGQSLVLNAESTGGIAPYKYKYTVTNLTTGEMVFDGLYGDDRSENVTITDSLYGGKNNAYVFDRPGDYKVTVYSSDYTDNTVTTDFEVNVADHKSNLKSFVSKNGQTTFGTDTDVESVYTEEFGDFKTNYDLIIFRDNKEYDRKKISANTGVINPKTGLVTGEFKWTIGEPGRYQVILCKTNGSEYSYTEFFANATPGLNIKSFNITTPYSTIAAGDKIDLNIQAENGTEPYGYIFYYFRYGKVYYIQDYSENGKATFKVPDQPGAYTIYVLAVDQDEKLACVTQEIWVEPKR